MSVTATAQVTRRALVSVSMPKGRGDGRLLLVRVWADDLQVGTAAQAQEAVAGAQARVAAALDHLYAELLFDFSHGGVEVGRGVDEVI
ncbi:hypothetical protein GCM10020001_031860 [Nonomuraea salmonea]